MTAAHRGTFKETFAIGKAYAEAHKQHGESERLDEIVSAEAHREDGVTVSDQERAALSEISSSLDGSREISSGAETGP